MRHIYEVGRNYLFVQTVNQKNVLIGPSCDLFMAKDKFRPWMHPVREIKLMEVACDFVCKDGSAIFKDYLGHMWGTPIQVKDVTAESHGAAAVQLLPQGYDDPDETALAYSYPYVPFDDMAGHLLGLFQNRMQHSDDFHEATRQHLERLNQLLSAHNRRTVEQADRNSVRLQPPLRWSPLFTKIVA